MGNKTELNFGDEIKFDLSYSAIFLVVKRFFRVCVNLETFQKQFKSVEIYFQSFKHSKIFVGAKNQ